MIIMIKKIYLVLLSCVLLFSAKAQIFYSLKDSMGTYVPITGTYPTLKALATGAGVASQAYDDGFVNAITIPFSFTYNGVAYTKFNLCSNGFIGFGAAFAATASTTAPTYYSSPDLTGKSAEDTGQRAIIAPFWTDLIFTSAKGNAAQGISYTTTGTTPNRVFTIQWHNAGWDAGATAGSISFQIKLFETSNNIWFVYNQENGAIINSGNGNNASIGLTIKAFGLGTFISLSDSTNSATASKVTETAITGRPASGQIYIFKPITPIANDAGITKVYATNVVATAADPQNISAMITNAGTATLTKLPVTLNITGANTYSYVFTIGSLASGKSGIVTFPTFTPTNKGVNNISVTVPSDGDTANNSGTVSQLVTLGTLNYMSKLTPDASVGVSVVSDWAAKFTNPGSHAVNTILLNFADTLNGSQPFTVSIWDTTGTDVSTKTGAPGSIIWSSSQPLSTTPGVMAIKTDSSIKVNGDFFVVVSQTDTLGYNLGYERESPVRTKTFYIQTATLGGFLDNANSGAPYIKLDVGVQFDSTSTTPVSLLKFSGSKLNTNANLLRWTTATESNNAGFDVLRSTDGINFKPIATVSSKAILGNSNVSLDYNYTDNSAAKGTSYYRLNQRNKNGQTSFSGILALKDVAAAFKIASIYPNPVVSGMTLNISSPVELKATSVITDITGKILATRNFSIYAGDNMINYDVNNLKAGNYIIKVTTVDGSSQTQMFEKK